MKLASMSPNKTLAKISSTAMINQDIESLPEIFDTHMTTF
jgi:hypothetical protein